MGARMPPQWWLVGRTRITVLHELTTPTCAHLPFLQVLAQPFHLDRKGEVPAGKQETYQTPVFTFSDGQLSVNYSRPFLETASRHPGVPDWTLEQVRRFGEVATASKTPTRRSMEWYPLYFHSDCI